MDKLEYFIPTDTFTGESIDGRDKGRRFGAARRDTSCDSNGCLLRGVGFKYLRWREHDRASWVAFVVHQNGWHSFTGESIGVRHDSSQWSADGMEMETFSGESILSEKIPELTWWAGSGKS